MRALVTGAAVRVGRQIAHSLASAGFDLVLHYRSSRGPAESLAGELRALGVDVELLRADLADPLACQALVTATAARGPLDVLVNNAALYEDVPLEALDLERWDRMQAVNCRAPFLLAQGLAPLLAHSSLPGGGLVLNLADIGAERPAPGFLHYAVSKAGVVMLTKALALELAPRVRANAISPGTVLPPEDLGPQQLDRMRRSIPAGRFGTPSDISSLVVFLALHAPYVSGQIWSVDGGRSVVGPLALDRPGAGSVTGS